MNTAPDAPRRPALRYYGGKWKLAAWIISHFPDHQNYVEPCGGAASVLLQKPRSPLETYNDLDGNVVNFFRVLRDQPDELIRKIRLTPWARAEYELSLEPCEDAVERARRFAVSGLQSLHRGADAKPVDWKYWRRWEKAQGDGPERQTKFVGGLYAIAERMSKVQIEQKSYADILALYDCESSLCYFDPPYVLPERSRKNGYAFEWTEKQHKRAADLLRQCSGYVVVSGYACPLYTELYEAHSWQRVDKEAQTNSGGKRIESLWLSPRTVEALQQPRQAELFTLGAH